MTVEEALAIVDAALEQESLSDIQELVFRQSWRNRTYEEIARKSGYDTVYIRDVGSRLWKLLSKGLGQKITKANFQSVLRRRAYQIPELAGRSPVASLSKSFSNSVISTVAESIQESIDEIAKIIDEIKELAKQSKQIAEDLKCFVSTNKVIVRKLQQGLSAVEDLQDELDQQN